MKRVINSTNAPKAIGPYSQAIEINGTLYISGQLPIDVATGKLVGEGISEQAAQCMKNIEAILKEAGYGVIDIVKSTVLLADMNDFSSVNEVYANFYKEPYPARVAYQVAKLPLGALIEIETIAAK